MKVIIMSWCPCLDRQRYIAESSTIITRHMKSCNIKSLAHSYANAHIFEVAEAVLYEALLQTDVGSKWQDL